MARPLSLDLRQRVVGAIAAGLSCRQAAERFGVGTSTATRWRALARQTGAPAARPQGGDRRSGRIEAHAGLILSLFDSKPDITLAEIKAELATGRGVEVGIGTLWRFFKRRRITRKKRRRTRASRNGQTS